MKSVSIDFGVYNIPQIDVKNDFIGLVILQDDKENASRLAATDGEDIH